MPKTSGLLPVRGRRCSGSCPLSCVLSCPRVPKEKPKAEAAPKPRHGPTDEAQMAAAAALARMELKPKAKPPSSQGAIKNQGRRFLADTAGMGQLG